MRKQAFANLSQQSLAGEKSMMCNGYMLDLPTHNRQVKGILCFILLNSRVALPREWAGIHFLYWQWAQSWMDSCLRKNDNIGLILFNLQVTLSSPRRRGSIFIVAMYSIMDRFPLTASLNGDL